MTLGNEGREDVVIEIEGMSCGGCVRSVTAALSRVAGVAVRTVEVGRAVVGTRDTLAMEQALDAVRDAGFEARVVSGPAGPVAG